MKHPLATIDLFGNLVIPHKPCPLVNPLLSFVPKPTIDQR
jgi:hypothetical protein